MENEKYDVEKALPNGDKKPRPKKGETPPPADPVGNVPKPGTTFGHEGGYAFNEDQRGGHTPPPEKKEEEPPKTVNRRKLDPELKAMDEVCEILEGLDAAVRGRVLAWACQKFKAYPSGVILHVGDGQKTDDFRVQG